MWLAAITAADRWDDESWSVLTRRHVRVARTAGDLSVLPLSLNSLVSVHLFAGEPAAAASVVAEIQAIGEATGVEAGAVRRGECWPPGAVMRPPPFR